MNLNFLRPPSLRSALPRGTILCVDTERESFNLWYRFLEHAASRMGWDFDSVPYTNDRPEELAREVCDYGCALPILFFYPPRHQSLRCKYSPDYVLSTALSLCPPGWEHNFILGLTAHDKDLDKDPLVSLVLSKSTDFLEYKATYLPPAKSLSSMDVEVLQLSDLTVLPASDTIHITRLPPTGTIAESHKELAYSTDAKMMLVVDADNRLVADPTLPTEPDKVYIYHAENPYNGLVYGHGAPKVFPTAIVRNLDLAEMPENMDFTKWVSEQTPHGLQVIPQLVATHKYATSRHSGITTAYREAYKLRCQIINRPPYHGLPVNEIEEAVERLAVWTSGNYPSHHKYQAQAARIGVVHANHQEELNSRINDAGYLDYITTLVEES